MHNRRRGLARNERAPSSMLDVTFEAFVFDWDGTAVPDRKADAVSLRQRIEALCDAGLHLFIVSGTNVNNVDGQLNARPKGRGRLYLCSNRGSEVFEVGDDGPKLVTRRTATREEDRALDRSATRTANALRARGLDVNVIRDRLNRRKIDLIPEKSWADPKKADIDRLVVAVRARLTAAGIGGLGDVVAMANDAAKAEGLRDLRITSDVKHVEIGLTDKSESARFAASWLAERGITGRLIAILGDEMGPLGGVPGSDSLMMIEALARATVVSVGLEPEGVPDGVVQLGGGAARFLALLDAQLARRTDRRVPQIDDDPHWVLPLPTSRVEERVAESLATLGNGYAATRGSREEEHEGATPLLLVNGIYGKDGRLIHGPKWTGLELPSARRLHSERRLLDLRTATLLRFDEAGRGLRSMRFVSAASPHAMALRAEAPEDQLDLGEPLRSPQVRHELEREDNNGVSALLTRRSGAEIAVAAHDVVGTSASRRLVERVAAWVAASSGGVRLADARRLLGRFEAEGFDALLAAHREAWARRWIDAEVVIEGDPDSELASRFAVFHLLSAAQEAGEAAVGARGLTGDAYAGHVFWDADVFVLPALAAIQPAAARAVLEYRIRRLPAARAAAPREVIEVRAFLGSRPATEAT